MLEYHGVPVIHSIFAVAVCCVIVYQVVFAIREARRNKIDLPGPRGWPLVGAGLDIPARPRKMLNEYRAKYGDAFKMRFGWYNWVFFNTPEGVREVFDRQVSQLDIPMVCIFRRVIISGICNIAQSPSPNGA